jgi:hypothetical protein
MKKRLIAIVSAVCFVGAFGVVSLASAGIDNGPEKITLNVQKQNPDFVKKHSASGIVKDKDKKKVPDFPHKKHQDELVKGKQSMSLFKYTDDWTCGACHHTTKKDEQPSSCLKCKDEDLDKMFDKAKIKGKNKFENIYHKSCRDGCHKAYDKAEKKKTAKCKSCHKK